ncbi:MAG: hypothetical protein LBH10_03690 [Burkholderiaceae bacterium]|nr:hypothetical protein [Burkholderiaceae bacterium]
MALYRACDEVLHYVWDPIGIATIPQARDEYYGYLPVIFDMIRDGRQESDIAKYLTHVVTVCMGLSKANDEHTISVVRLLLEWKRVIHERGGEKG